MKHLLNTIAIVAITAILLNACKKEDPIIPNEEELITTLIYTLNPSNGGDVKILKFEDLDGDGGNAPVYTVDNLEANTTYEGKLQILNELYSPAEDITEEIAHENQEHQFFFTTDNNVELSITYNDKDANENPVGLESTLTTGNASTGKLTVILRHEPNKFAEGVADGDITNAGGETDIQVTFNVVVQ